MRATPGTGCGPCGAALARAGLRSGGALSECAVSRTVAFSIPSIAAIAASAASRTGVIAVAWLGAISITKRAVAPSTESARTSPADTMSPPPGASIPLRTARTSSRVGARLVEGSRVGISRGCR